MKFSDTHKQYEMASKYFFFFQDIQCDKFFINSSAFYIMTSNEIKSFQIWEWYRLVYTDFEAKSHFEEKQKFFTT